MARSANPRPVTGGMYVPVITPFDDNEEIDFQKFEAHVRKVADAGCGIVVMGTNGEGEKRRGNAIPSWRYLLTPPNSRLSTAQPSTLVTLSARLSSRALARQQVTSPSSLALAPGP